MMKEEKKVEEKKVPEPCPHTRVEYYGSAYTSYPGSNETIIQYQCVKCGEII